VFKTSINQVIDKKIIIQNPIKLEKDCIFLIFEFLLISNFFDFFNNADIQDQIRNHIIIKIK
jgi:hypothetical protein